MYRKNSRKRLSKKRSAFKKRTINRKKKTYRKGSNKRGGSAPKITDFSRTEIGLLAKRRTDFQSNWESYYPSLLKSEDCQPKYLQNFEDYKYESERDFLFIKCYTEEPKKSFFFTPKPKPHLLLAVQFLLSEENKVRIFTTSVIGELLLAIDVNNNFILENGEQRVNLKRSYLSIDNIPHKICFNRVGRDELYDPWTDIKLLRKKFKKNGFVIIGNY